MVEKQQEGLGNIAAELFRQGEQCALHDLLQPAETLLIQTWTIAAERDPDLANAAAWEVAWLLVRRGAYYEAVEWFNRVGAPLSRESQLWLVARRALVQLCLHVANPVCEPAPVSVQPPRAQPIAPQAPAASKPPVLNVISLGRFQILRGGVALPACRVYKAMALFRYLLTQRSHAAYKEELMELLWPNTRAREAANSLHVTVNILRRYLDSNESSSILFHDGHYRINPNVQIEDDSRCFQRLSASAGLYWHNGDLLKAEQDYTAAIAYYQGDYYIDNRDLAWAFTERERLLALYLSALDHLGQIYVAQQRCDLAVECFQRLLERDSYREDAHYQLMKCYWQLGRRCDALRQYKSCAAILVKDLGLEPMQELQALYIRIFNRDSTDARGW